MVSDISCTFADIVTDIVHADIGKGEAATTRGYGDLVMPVHVCGGNYSRDCLLHRHADQRLPAVIFHIPRGHAFLILLLIRDYHHVAVNLVVAVQLVENLLQDILYRFVLFHDGYPGKPVGQLRLTEEVQSTLLGHLIKEILHVNGSEIQ